MDAVHFKVRQDGKVISKAAYNIVAIDLQVAAVRGVKLYWVFISATPKVPVSSSVR